MRTIGKALMALGILLFVAATVWWVMFFEPLLGDEVKRASECFYRTPPVCELGNVVGSFGRVPAYRPVAFWSALAVFALGLVVYGLAVDRSTDHRP